MTRGGPRSRTAPDAPYLEQLGQTPFRPVFIMGSARSGTTILYRLLTMTGRFNCVTAYHLVKYDELLANHAQGRTEEAKREVSALFDRLGISGARFDGVEVSPDFPEEYGFGLTEGSRLQLTPRTLPRFLQLCRKVQEISAPERPLLLKNPWDSRAFLYIKRVLPQSRFVFIHRNPADVVPSLLDGMRKLLRDRNAYHALVARSYDRLMEQPLRLRAARLFFSPRLGLGSRLVRWQVARTARYFVDHVGELPAADQVSVRYEDLCRDPGAVVNQVLRALGEAENHEIPYREFIRIRERPRGERGDADRGAILRQGRLRPYLAFCGYETE
jgi:hypothetical protein